MEESGGWKTSEGARRGRKPEPKQLKPKQMMKDIRLIWYEHGQRAKADAQLIVWVVNWVAPKDMDWSRADQSREGAGVIRRACM